MCKRCETFFKLQIFQKIFNVFCTSSTQSIAPIKVKNFFCNIISEKPIPVFFFSLQTLIKKRIFFPPKWHTKKILHQISGPTALSFKTNSQFLVLNSKSGFVVCFFLYVFLQFTVFLIDWRCKIRFSGCWLLEIDFILWHFQKFYRPLDPRFCSMCFVLVSFDKKLLD